MVTEIPAEIVPEHINCLYTSPKLIKIFPDSGASICLGGTHHLSQLGLKKEELIPCRKRVSAVGGLVLTCRGWIPAEFKVGNHCTKHPLYICDKVDRIYFSRKACTDVKILPKTFPFPISDYSIT